MVRESIYMLLFGKTLNDPNPVGTPFAGTKGIDLLKQGRSPSGCITCSVPDPSHFAAEFCVNAQELYKTSWEFSTDGNTEGWTGTNIESYSVGGGRYFIDPAATDPYISSPNTSASATSYDMVLLKMVSNAPDGNGAVYFRTQADNNYSESKKIIFKTANEPGGSASWYDYPVYFGNLGNWTGTITGIRIDPSDYGQSGTSIDTVGFDYIKLINHTSLANINNSQHIANSGNITVSPNQSFTIWFDVKNTGSSVWSENTFHRLGWLSGYNAFPDYQSKWRIIKTDITKPQQTTRWSVTLTAPSTPGSYP